MPAGSAAKALLFGAKTVNGPGPSSVSTRPAALTAATSVVWSAEFTAFWMMFLLGNIGAPPTIGLAAKPAPALAMRAAAAATVAKRFMSVSPGLAAASVRLEGVREAAGKSFSPR